MSSSTPSPVSEMDRRIDAVLTAFAAAPLLLILVLTFVDVLARYAFASPIKGGVEIIEFAMASLIFAALPLVTRQRMHVTVSLVDGLFQGRAGQIKLAVCDAVSALTLAVLAWRLWIQATDDWDERTATIVLGWFYAPLYFTMAILTGLTCLATLLLIYSNLSKRSNP